MLNCGRTDSKYLISKSQISVHREEPGKSPGVGAAPSLIDFRDKRPYCVRSLCANCYRDEAESGAYSEHCYTICRVGRFPFKLPDVFFRNGPLVIPIE